MNSNNRGIFRTIISNLKRPSFQGAVAAIVVHLSIVFLAYQLYLTKASQNELNLINHGNKVKYELEQIFNTSITSLTSASLSLGRDGSISGFKEIATQILEENSYLKQIAVLPAGKYKAIYPQNNSTKSLLGFDLLRDGDPRMVKRIYDGIYSRQMGFAGPFPDTKYESVIIGYNPIFLNNRFWGLYMTSMPVGKVFEIVDTIKAPGLNFTISNFDPITKKRYLIYTKDTDVTKNGNKNSYSEKILHNNWHLHVNAPKTSWLKILLAPYIISLLIATLVGAYINGMVYSKRRLSGTEQALKRYDIKFRSIFENAPIGIAQIDFATRKLTEVNKKFCELTGFKSSELIGRGLPEIIPPEYYQRSREEFDRSIEQPGGQLQKLYKHRNKNGQIAYVNFTVKPVVEADGTINMNVLVVEDITEAEIAKQALTDSEIRYKSLFKDSPIALWDQDYSQVKAFLGHIGMMNKSRGEISAYFTENLEHFKEAAARITTLDNNKAALDLYGMKRNEDLHSALGEMINHKDGWDIIFTAFTAVSNNLPKYSVDATTHTQAGPLEVHYEWNVMPGYEHDLSRVTVAMVDITQLKHSQAALEETNKRLEVSEKHYKSLFEDSPVALWEQDFSGLRQYFIDNDLMNRTYDEIFNYFVENANAFEDCYNLFKIYAVNKSAVELYDATNKTELLNNVKFLLASPASMNYTILALTSLSNGMLSSEYETTIFTLSENIKHIDYRWNVAPGYESDYSRVIVAMNDITGLKHAEIRMQEAARALQISQERFKALFDDSPIALWEEDFSGVKNYLIQKDLWQQPFDIVTKHFNENPGELQNCMKELKVLSANKEALKSYNAGTLEEAILSLSQALNQPESEDAFLMQLVMLCDGSLKLKKEARTVNEKGETVYLELNWNVLPGHEENLERVIVSTNDITPIKQSEQEIEAARARLETIINTIDGIV